MLSRHETKRNGEEEGQEEEEREEEELHLTVLHVGMVRKEGEGRDAAGVQHNLDTTLYDYTWFYEFWTEKYY